MTAFNQFAPGSAKVTDGNGNATAAFQIWMRNVWLRGGGADALSAAELEALITTAQAEIDALEGVVAALQHDDLGGLTDDDHPQYHNDARGDLRYQPLDADLTAIAALTTTAFGRALLELADAAALAAAHTHAQLHDAATVSDSTTIDLTLTGQQISGAVISQMSITADASGIKLSGDAAAPGNDKLYGTDGSGVKGWYSQPSGSGLTHPQVLARGLGA